MNDMPLHPAIVHLPLGLAMLIPLLALGAAVAIHRGSLPRWLWGGVLALQLLMVAGGLAAMNTGERDEEVVEDVVSERLIHEHEEAAERFVWVSAALGLLFALGVALPKPKWRSVAMAASVIGSLGAAGLALDVGHEGGVLVYRHGAAAAHATPGGAATRAEDEDDDD
ncbi:MAG: hypothetical protein H6719_36870 [Sandaracinaceae bacterium]|nr:hypothetical protein [Sandaracinaceae bacterium]